MTLHVHDGPLGRLDDLHYETLLALAGSGPDETDPLGHPPATPASCPVCRQRFVDAGAAVPECHRCGAVLNHQLDRPRPMTTGNNPRTTR